MSSIAQEQHVLIEALGKPATWESAYAELNSAGQSALPAIYLGLKNPAWRVRRWCAALLDHHADAQDARGIAALVEALQDSSPTVRRHAVHALGCQRCKQLPLELDLIALLIERAQNDSNLRVRQVATHMLGNQATDKRAVQALQIIIKNEQDEKLLGNARWALEQLTRHGWPR